MYQDDSKLESFVQQARATNNGRLSGAEACLVELLEYSPGSSVHIRKPNA